MRQGLYLSKRGELVELTKSTYFDYNLYSSQDHIFMRFNKISKWILDDYIFIGHV